MGILYLKLSLIYQINGLKCEFIIVFNIQFFSSFFVIKTTSFLAQIVVFLVYIYFKTLVLVPIPSEFITFAKQK